ncbi:MAG: pirin family protein [Bryobacteraceae bacterium]|jgi:redox-sensitive bicupin YhaK (pirin superfamily)
MQTQQQAQSEATSTPTILLRRSQERGFEDFGWTDNYMTFSFGGYRDPVWNNFGPLRVMIENHIQPRSGFPTHPHRDAEIVTYVAAGTLTHRDNMGHQAAITAGEMQHISAGSRGIVHSEENLADVVEHNYQMWLIPDRPGTTAAYHQLKFTPEERQGRFRLYVSRDGEDGSMPINTDARIYAGLFRAGDAVRHAIEAGWGAWIQIVHGQLRVAGLELKQGDGVGIANARDLEFQFDAASEVLLFDVRMDAPLLWR